MRIVLCALLVSCGGTPSKSSSTSLPAKVATSPRCIPRIDGTPLSFQMLEDETASKKIPERELDTLEATALEIGNGNNLNYAFRTPGDNIAVAIGGCEEEECAAGVGVLQEGENNSYTILSSAALPEVNDIEVSQDRAFLSDLIGDKALEFGVIYSVAEEESEKSLTHIALYSLPDLDELWASNLTPTTDCVRTIHRADLNCDEKSDLVVQTHCMGVLTDSEEFVSK